MKNIKGKIFKTLRILLRILLGVIILLILLVLFIRSPWGQNLLIDRYINSLSQKTGTVIRLDRAFISFSGDIEVNDLYLEDQTGDTLIYSKTLEASIPLWSIIKGQGISINSLRWDGLKANIKRRDTLNGFNFEFLSEAMSSKSKASPDSISKPLQVDLGEITLHDIVLNYKDDVSALETSINVGDLKMEVRDTDLEKMEFRIGDAAISNSNIVYAQTGMSPESDTATSLLPFISLKNLKVNNVEVSYNSVPDSLKFYSEISEFETRHFLADLSNKNIKIGSIILNNSMVNLESNVAQETIKTDKPSISEFEWPDWKLKVDKVSLGKDQITYFENGAVPQKGIFKPNALKFDRLQLEAGNIFYKNKEAGATVKDLAFQEASGMDLSNLAFGFRMNDSNMKINDLLLDLNQNYISGEANLKYTSFAKLLEKPEAVNFAMNINEMSVDPGEIFRFQPELRKNSYIEELSKKRLNGKFHFHGTLSELNIAALNLRWGKYTSLTANGVLKNPAGVEKMEMDLPHLVFKTTRPDVLNFIKEDSIGVKIPESLSLNGSFKGNMEKLHAKARLNSSDGNIDVDGDFSVNKPVTFNTDLIVNELNLGELLQNEKLGKLSLKLKASGEGGNINNLNSRVEANINSFTYNGYKIKDLPITGELENGKGTISSSYHDKNLNIKLNAFAQLDSVQPQIDANLDIIGARLDSLGLSSRDIRMAMEINASFKGNAQEYEISSNISKGVTVYNNQTYLLGDFNATAYVRPDSTSVKIANRMIDLDLESNANPQDFSRAIKRHFQSYLSDKIEIDTVNNPVNLKLKMNVNPAPVLTKVFLVNLTELDTVNMNVDFSEKERRLDSRIILPHIVYYGSKIDSLDFTLNSDPGNFKFDLGFTSLDAGPLVIHETHTEGSIRDKKLYLDFIANYMDKKLIQTKWVISREDDGLNLHLDPSGLILNQNPWNISTNNGISIGPKHLSFNNFKLSRNNRQMLISNRHPGVSGEHIGVDFSNFNLAVLLSYLNPETKLASGDLNGNLVIKEPFGNTALIADLGIKDFKIAEVDMGSLKLDASAKDSRNYQMNLTTKGGHADTEFTGSYKANDTAALLDMDLYLNKIDMKAVEGFSAGAIKNGSGSFSGHIELGGTTANPEYDGNLDFNNAGFNIALLNANFLLKNESLKLDNAGIYFDDFKVLDEKQNAFVINGNIKTESYLNPEFDLNFQAENFQALNSTKEDNDLFYGTAIFDLDATVKGDLNLPRIDMKLDVGPNTNMTYVVPENELAVQEREGMVIFVNRENPESILTQTEEKSEIFAGYDIHALVSVDDDAAFKIVIDEETGDNFLVRGKGDLDFNIYPNGRTTLTGRYVMSGGHYEMSLYNLVKRRFEIADGSTITWSGDPFDAKLDVRAIYKVEASASSLMASSLSGADASIENQYRRQLPFLVYLNVDGELMQPSLSFNLDMPEDEQGVAGGQVYGRVKQLNNQEEELNKQVFSLLVLNRFYPEPGSSGSRGGTVNIARDNLNQALSDQLNMFSDKLLGDTGVNLNFGVDSYTDYQGESAQQRTQLDITAQKKLMGDRLIVSVGSEVDVQGGNQPGEPTSPIIGNVSIEYLLTPSGQFRIKGFRRNEFENVIDGQVIVSGIALIFTREFNEFREVWKNLIKEEVEKEKPNKKSTKND